MIISAKRIITGDGKTVLTDQAICFDKNSIKRIAPLNDLILEFPDHEVKEFGDSTILPGLIDMHVHIGYTFMRPDESLFTPFLKTLLAFNNLRKAFEAGVTTIRDVASETGLCVGLKTASQRDYIEIPRLISCEAGIAMTGGHGWQIGKGEVVEVDGPWELRKAIRTQIREGADWIKIMTSHRTSTPEFTQEELNAAVDECHRVGKKVAVHAGAQPSIGMAIKAGFDTIEHGTFITVEQAIEMKEKNLVWVPTIIAYNHYFENYIKPSYEKNLVTETEYLYVKRAVDAYTDNFMKIADTGVKIVAGTDLVSPGAPTTPVAKELAYMVKFGMTPLAAIQSATNAPAEVLGLCDKIGLIKEGFLADILVVSGDASTDIKALENVSSVFYAGKKII